MSRLSRIAREPLVHFLVLGALLFVYFEIVGRDAGPDSRRIVISGAQVEHLAASFARTWQRPPTVDELKGLVDDYVREEIAVREAMAMGLDRDDTIIRRRLRQKLEFITQDVIDSNPPTTEQLEDWYRAHLDDYTAEAQVAFEQACNDMSDGLVTTLSEQDAEAIAAAEAAGVTFMEFGEQEATTFRGITQEVWADWGSRSPNAQAIVDSHRAFLGTLGLN